MVNHKPSDLPDEKDCEEFGTVLRQLRKRKGFTQKTLAKALHVATSKINDLEKNRVPPSFNPKDLKILSEVLMCNEAEFLRLYRAYLCYFWY